MCCEKKIFCTYFKQGNTENLLQLIQLHFTFKIWLVHIAQNGSQYLSIIYYF